jgi:hypothetical protein
MPFTVFAAADLYGQKVNLEVDFPAGPPSLGDLRAVLQGVFANEALAIRPPSRPLQAFGIQKIQVFRETAGTWDDVLSAAQVTEFSQLYVFQSDPSFRESQEQIQPARKPSRAATTPAAAPAPVPQPPAAPSSSSVSGPYGAGVAASSARISSVSPPRRGLPSGSLPAAASAIGGGGGGYGSALSVPVRVGAPPSSAVALPPMPRTTVPAAPTQGEKIRFLFDEMDTSGNRVISPSEFQEMLRYLNVDFSNATISDLYRKADVDHDGVLSIKEFTAFFTSYPTLLDALFFRLRDLGELRALQIQLAQEQDALLAARERADRAQAVSSEVQRVLDQQRDALLALEREWEAKIGRDAQARNLLRQAAEDVLAAQAQRAAVQQDVVTLGEREKGQTQAVAASGNDAKELERRLAQQQSVQAQAEEKLRQLQALLADAQRETLRAREEAQVLASECARAREREQQAAMVLLDVQREGQRARELLGASERDLLSKSEIQREAKRVVDDSQADLGALRKRIEEQKREIGICGDRDAESRQLAGDAQLAVVQHERKVVSKDDEIRGFAQQRSQLEEQERPLLEQEVRLREQRESLEEKELRLRRESMSLFDAPGAAQRAAVSPPRYR